MDVKHINGPIKVNFFYKTMIIVGILYIIFH